MFGCSKDWQNKGNPKIFLLGISWMTMSSCLLCRDVWLLRLRLRNGIRFSDLLPDVQIVAQLPSGGEAEGTNCATRRFEANLLSSLHLIQLRTCSLTCFSLRQNASGHESPLEGRNAPDFDFCASSPRCCWKWTKV